MAIAVRGKSIVKQMPYKGMVFNFLKPYRAVQICGELQDSAKRCYTYEEWEPPEGAIARLFHGYVTFAPPRDAAFQAHRMFGRSAWSEEAPNHINPVAPGAGAVCCESEFSFQALCWMSSFNFCLSDGLVDGRASPGEPPA